MNPDKAERLDREIHEYENRIHHLDKLAHESHAEERAQIQERIEELRKREESLHFRKQLLQYSGEGFWDDLRTNVGDFVHGMTGGIGNIFRRLRHH